MTLLSSKVAYLSMFVLEPFLRNILKIVMTQWMKIQMDMKIFSLQQATTILDEFPLDPGASSRSSNTAIDATVLPRVHGLMPSIFAIANGEFECMRVSSSKFIIYGLTEEYKILNVFSLKRAVISI